MTKYSNMGAGIALVIHIMIYSFVVYPVIVRGPTEASLMYILPSTLAYLPVSIVAWVLPGVFGSIHAYTGTLLILGGAWYCYLGFVIGRRSDKKRQIVSGFIFDMPSKAGGLRIDIPSGIRAKEMLFAKIGLSLHLPSGYSTDFDSFDRCVSDLSWLAERDIIIRHADVPLADDAISARKYLDILRVAVAKWSRESSHRLYVVFPAEFRDRVQEILKS
jgi:hypothetical protein